MKSCPYTFLNQIGRKQQESELFIKLHMSSKYPFRQGVLIHVFNNHHTKPVDIMHDFRLLRISQMLDQILLCWYGWLSSTRNQFIIYIRHVLVILGYDDTKYCGHSLRIGVATSAAEAGIEDHLIQTLGRWSSSCYVRYISTDEKVLKVAQNKMCFGRKRVCMHIIMIFAYICDSFLSRLAKRGDSLLSCASDFLPTTVFVSIRRIN